MSTISQPVTRKSMRLRVDMLARGVVDGSTELISAGLTDTIQNYTLFDNIRIEYPVLFQEMRNGVLRKQGRL